MAESEDSAINTILVGFVTSINTILVGFVTPATTIAQAERKSRKILFHISVKIC